MSFRRFIDWTVCKLNNFVILTGSSLQCRGDVWSLMTTSTGEYDHRCKTVKGSAFTVNIVSFQRHLSGHFFSFSFNKLIQSSDKSSHYLRTCWKTSNPRSHGFKSSPKLLASFQSSPSNINTILFEELLSQLSYAIKNQLKMTKCPILGAFLVIPWFFMAYGRL